MEFFPWINNIEKLKETLAQLEAKAPALWGKMDAQQMVEHLNLVLEISNGTLDVVIYTPEKYIEKSQAFLMSQEPLPRNFVAKFIPEEPITHKNADLKSAVEVFLNSAEKHQKYWHEKDAENRNHPVFGNLNKTMWDCVHNKHITHHFIQFSLIEGLN